METRLYDSRVHSVLIKPLQSIHLEVPEKTQPDVWLQNIFNDKTGVFKLGDIDRCG